MRSVLWLLSIVLLACDVSNQQPVTPSEVVGNPGIAQPAANQAGASAMPANASPLASGAPSVAPPAVGAAEPTFSDDRPPVAASHPPPAISGGTLLLVDQGQTAVVADSDRDRVSIVDLRKHKLLREIALKPGDEPGRLIADPSGTVHVALRGSGDLAALNIASGSVGARVHACADPRGIAFDADADALHVACKSGDLVRISRATYELQSSTRVSTDLRDVVVRDGRLFVSQFRTANLLEVTREGQMMTTHRPHDVRINLALGREAFSGLPTLHHFSAGVARRMIPLADGKILMLHQRALDDTVDIKNPGDEPSPDDTMPNGERADQGGYGGGDGCNAIVQTTISVLDDRGALVQSRSIAGSVLGVDVAVSSNGTVAVANAGLHDPNTPINTMRGTFFASAGISGAGVSLFEMRPSQLEGDDDQNIEGCASGDALDSVGQPTAVAFTPDGALVVQSREPAMLTVYSPDARWDVRLGGDSFADTGHDLFHRDSGGGIACASCHAEGGDDAHVWDFRGIGVRRTQSLNIHLRGTAPFHWSGDMPDFDTLMSEVFVNRMSGTPQSKERVTALSEWIYELPKPPALRAPDSAGAVHGKQLFESESVACASCHNGASFTNNKSEDVGTGGKFQVPGLLGIAHRAPFLHTGCAATLHDRFAPACGGEKHGHTSQLSSTDIDDLVAYLETL